MKKILISLALLSTITISWAQADFFTKKGVVVNGYDVTEYFNNVAIKGDKKHNAIYDDAVFYFSTESNKDKFESNPEKYIPQYGGYCAYAIGVKGEKVSINPKSFEIRDGKLYMFYKTIFVNTLDLWNEKNPELLKVQADNYWSKLTEN